MSHTATLRRLVAAAAIAAAAVAVSAIPGLAAPAGAQQTPAHKSSTSRRDSVAPAHKMDAGTKSGKSVPAETVHVAATGTHKKHTKHHAKHATATPTGATSTTPKP